MRVRQAVESDARSLAELNSVVQLLHYDNEPDRFKPPDPAEFEPVVHDRLLQPEVRAFIAEEATGRPIGYVLAVVRERQDNTLVRGGRFVELDEIEVLPEYRQSGVGRLLAECVLAYAHEVGVTEVELTAWDFNVTAQVFFSKLGFRFRHHRMVATILRT